MNVKISFDKDAVERQGCRLEDARQIVKNLFAVHHFPSDIEDGVLKFKDKGHGDDFAVMWDIILPLLRADWFLDCVVSCVWQDEDGEEDVLSQVRKTQGSVRQ